MGVGHCHHSEKDISENMKVILSIFGLVGLTMAMPHLQEPKNARSVNEMIDAVESGMASPEDPHARALFVSLTLTSTSTMLDTTTKTTTVTNSCWSGTISECTTTTTTGSKGRRKREVMMFHDMVHDYTYGFTVIDVETGEEVDPMTIIAPTAVARQDEVLDVLNADLVVDSNVELESGSLTWKEVAVDGKSRSSCARSDHDEKRARIIALANEVVTLSLTSTSTITSTAATTKTFSVAVSCTTAGSTFGVSMC